jgi:hypothetical protein
LLIEIEEEQRFGRHEMSLQSESHLVEALDTALRTHMFKSVDDTVGAALSRDFGVDAAWLWRVSGSRGNLAVVVVPLPDSSAHPGRFAQEIKFSVGKLIGYFPFFRWFGLNFVFTGCSVVAQANDLDQYVDKINNQRAVVQSIHVVDLMAMDSFSARTWGQLVTGPVQDTIEEVIKSILSEQK